MCFQRNLFDTLSRNVLLPTLYITIIVRQLRGWAGVPADQRGGQQRGLEMRPQVGSDKT